MVCANDFAVQDGKLRVHLISTRSTVKKSDSFIVEYGGEYLLMDGGVKDFDRTLERLLAIRAALLEGHPELIGDENCKLRINYVLTHFHRDHADAFIHTVAPCKFIEVCDVYLPPMSSYVKPDAMKNMEDNFVDPMLRAQLTDALREHHSRSRITTLDFGKDGKRTFTTKTGCENEVKFTLFPPISDWGNPECIEKAVSYYSQTGTYHEHLGVWIVNQTSMWLKVELGENSFLFTGDTLKRRLDHDDEGLDEMIAAYGDEVRNVGFLKYIHHGLLRDEGAADIVSMNSDYIYFSGIGATGGDAILSRFPERRDELKQKFVYGEYGDITVTCSADVKKMEITQDVVNAKTYANDFANRDGILRVHLVSPRAITDKNDAFITEYGGEVLLIDGGAKANPSTLEKLLEIRRNMLASHPELISNRSCKLRINYIATHFHADHVGAFIKQIAPCPYIELGDVYLSPESSYVAPPCSKKKKEKNEAKRRLDMLSAIREYHHDTANVKVIGLGKENKLTFTTHTGMEEEVMFSIYPPITDIGSAENFDKTVSRYSPTGKFHENMPTWVQNALSLWVKVSLGENSFLFTADAMKRYEDLYDESLDEMMDAYGEELRNIGMLKYIHHGVSRDAAAARMVEFESDYIYFSGDGATGGDAILARFPERRDELKDKFLYGEKADLILSCTKDKKHIEVEKIPVMAKCYANDYVTRDGKLKIYLLSNNSAAQKDDAFVIEYEGEILVVDGGMNGANETQKKLLELRRKYLASHPELIDDVTCKLKINWLASHFHIDHVSDFIYNIIPDPYIEVKNVYIPPETEYVIPREGCDLDGDKKYRPKLTEQLERYQYGCYTVHEAKFGKENVYSFTSDTGSENEVEFTVYPPVNDWGVGERMAKIVKYYSKDDPYHIQAPMSLSNANSQWLRVKFGENVFLFTGDTMKRTQSRHDEPLDEMTEAYQEMIGKVDFMKYVHHGLSRDLAAELMLSYDPDYYLFTGRLATAGDAMIAHVSQNLEAIKEKKRNHEPLTKEELETESVEEAKIKALREKFIYGEKHDVTLTCTHDVKYIDIDKKARKTTVYVNDFAKKDGRLTFDFLEVPDHRGNDAFIARIDGEVMLLDGGNNNEISLKALMALRRDYCELGGVDPEDSNNKLRIDIIISHFHVDHVTATINHIVPCRFFEVRHVYMPVASVLTEDDYFDSYKNGDIVFRPAFLEAIERYQPFARIHEIDFCQQLTERLLDGKLRIDFYGATEDWGDGDVNDPTRGIGFIRHKYYATKDDAYTRFFLSIATVNANCMWCKFTYGEKTFLFVGDTFKKLSDEACGEPMDKVVEFYGGDEFKCDVLKFTHHGHHRRAARGITERYMKPEYVVFTIEDATSAPDMNKLGIKWLNCAFEPFTISTDGDSITTSIRPHSETHTVEDKEEVEPWGNNKK